MRIALPIKIRSSEEIIKSLVELRAIKPDKERIWDKITSKMEVKNCIKCWKKFYGFRNQLMCDNCLKI